MKKKNILIIGAGQNGFVIRNILAYDKNINIVGFLDDTKAGEGIVGRLADHEKFIKSDHFFFISIGDCAARKRIYTDLAKKGAQFVNAIHPSAVIEPSCKLGVNVFVGAFTYINVKSSIGDGTFINNGCIIEHDNTIGNFCHITPGVVSAGEVAVKDGTFIGIGSTLRDRIVIEKNCIIGAGSNVVASTEPDGVYYGNPAKLIKMNESL